MRPIVLFNRRRRRHERRRGGVGQRPPGARVHFRLPLPPPLAAERLSDAAVRVTGVRLRDGEGSRRHGPFAMLRVRTWAEPADDGTEVTLEVAVHGRRTGVALVSWALAVVTVVPALVVLRRRRRAPTPLQLAQRISAVAQTG